MERRLKFSLILAVVGTLLPVWNAQPQDERPRLLVLTDIGGDPDDQQSLVRLLLYSNEFEMAGFVASASGIPGELKKAVTKPELIHKLVDAYGKVFPNLTNHAAGYPLPDELRARIHSGNPQRGREAIGDGHNTEGANFIIELADRPDERPLNIAIWGGQTDFAQACWQVRNERGKDGLQKFLRHIRVYDIDDQDKIASWMAEEFAPPFYILAQASPGHDKRDGAYRGLYLGGDESLVSREWMEQHIRQNHGPLGALYPPRTWTAPNPYSAIKEGDTASWFYFLPCGFNDPNFPDWGSWGGRFNQAANGVWRDARDTVDGITDARSTVSRWRRAFQNDFAARLDWCVEPAGEANHRPVAALNGDRGNGVIHVHVKSGQPVRLDARGSSDPDADQIEYRWWRYWEAGSYLADVPLGNLHKPAIAFDAPTVDRPQTIHLILEVTDHGQPELTAFRRAVVEMTP